MLLVYLLMLAICLPWAWWAARRTWSPRFGVSLFFVGCFFMSAAEPFMVRILDLYDWRLWLLQDPEMDMNVGTYVVALLLDPLLGVIYAAYCQTRPVLKAFLASLAFGAMEIVLVQMGYMVYRTWHPLVTVACFFAYLLMIWRLTVKAPPWLVWLSVHGASLWFSWIYGVLPRAVLILWEPTFAITDDHIRDTRIVGILVVWLVAAPIATIVCMIRTRLRWLWAAGGVVLNLLIHLASVTSGLVKYQEGAYWYNLVIAVLTMGSVLLYTNWLRAGERKAT